MLIKPDTCPICGRSISSDSRQCATCGCIIQIVLGERQPARTEQSMPWVQQAVDRCRERLSSSETDGQAHYTLGLGYLHLDLLSEGLTELERAAVLLPEKDAIRYELAVLNYHLDRPAAGIDHIQAALRMAPNNLAYRYLAEILNGELARSRRDAPTALNHWLAAYTLTPTQAPAADALRDFIRLHEKKLTSDLAVGIPNLNQRDATLLQTLNTNPALSPPELPSPPASPPTPGAVSMRLLQKVAPRRAEAIEQMHSDRLEATATAAAQHESASNAILGRHASECANWEKNVNSIRADLVTMARLCLVVATEEERRRVVEAQRRAEEARARAAAEAERQARIEQNQAAQAAAAQERAHAPQQQEVWVKEYKNAKEYNNDAARMVRAGWQIAQQSQGSTHMNVGRTVVTTALTGGLNLVTPKIGGASWTKGKITVTWVRYK